MNTVPSAQISKTAALLAAATQPACLLTRQLQSNGGGEGGASLREEEPTGVGVALCRALRWAPNSIFTLISLEHCAKLIQKHHCTEKETESKSVISPTLNSVPIIHRLNTAHL